MIFNFLSDICKKSEENFTFPFVDKYVSSQGFQPLIYARSYIIYIIIVIMNNFYDMGLYKV